MHAQQAVTLTTGQTTTNWVLLELSPAEGELGLLDVGGNLLRRQGRGVTMTMSLLK